MNVLKVGRLVARISVFVKESLPLEGWLVEGEISNVRCVNGHYYFDLKDEAGQMACTMWKSNAVRLTFALKDGMKVRVKAVINFYEKRGTLQLFVSDVILAGEGALHAKFEELKKKLEAAGAFAPSHKKPAPSWIGSIGLVTGASTAALEDVMKTIRLRWPMLQVTLYPATVQGEAAPASIISALHKADQGGHDAVLLVRGGGSFEDLFCFNDEQLVWTIYNMNTYTVTGIGHEIDWTLSDFAADHRAVTPTAAAQWVTWDQNQVRASLKSMQQQMEQSMRRLFDASAARLVNVQSHPFLSNPQSWIDIRKDRLRSAISRMETLQSRYQNQLESSLRQQQNLLDTRMRGFIMCQKDRLAFLKSSLYMYSPMKLLALQQNKTAMMSAQLVTSIAQYANANRTRLVMADNRLQAGAPKMRVSMSMHQLGSLTGRMQSAAYGCLQQHQSLLEKQKALLFSLTPSAQIALEKQQLAQMEQSLVYSMRALLEKDKALLAFQTKQLDALSWQNTLKRGFSVVMSEGKIVRDVSMLEPGATMHAVFENGSVTASVLSVRPDAKDNS